MSPQSLHGQSCHLKDQYVTVPGVTVRLWLIHTKCTLKHKTRTPDKYLKTQYIYIRTQTRSNIEGYAYSYIYK